MAKEGKERGFEGPDETRLSYMPWWYKTWQTDQAVTRMCPAKYAVYKHMINSCMFYGEIPKSVGEYLESCCRMAGDVSQVWSKSCRRYFGELSEHFTETRPGFMCNKRVLKDLERRREICAARASDIKVEERRLKEMTSPPKSPPQGGDPMEVATQGNGGTEELPEEAKRILARMVKDQERSSRRYVD